jgi:hypothetical protein
MFEDASGGWLIRYFGRAVLLVIPKWVETIGESYFLENQTLESITFEADSVLRRIRESAFVSGNLKGTIALPRSGEVFSARCFCGCQLLETVAFEAGSALREIGEYAFQWSGLKSIVIPASVGVIRNSAFQGCQSLDSVTFEAGSGLREIGERAFAGLLGPSRLKSIVVPASVGVIGKNAFQGCESLETVMFEAGSVLHEIGQVTFK